MQSILWPVTQIMSHALVSWTEAHRMVRSSAAADTCTFYRRMVKAASSAFVAYLTCALLLSATFTFFRVPFCVWKTCMGCQSKNMSWQRFAASALVQKFDYKFQLSTGSISYLWTPQSASSVYVYLAASSNFDRPQQMTERLLAVSRLWSLAKVTSSPWCLSCSKCFWLTQRQRVPQNSGMKS